MLTKKGSFIMSRVMSNLLATTGITAIGLFGLAPVATAAVPAQTELASCSATGSTTNENQGDGKEAFSGEGTIECGADLSGSWKSRMVETEAGDEGAVTEAKGQLEITWSDGTATTAVLDTIDQSETESGSEVSGKGVATAQVTSDSTRFANARMEMSSSASGEESGGEVTAEGKAQVKFFSQE
ncbi:hypothetical protein G5C51_00645 [Streptomyces sp. A7024]|uniref:Uncharacterized protein n=1 Tax=Streptomyces coryli TaxID=1128680 RepID=A0A6G4TTV3_9ACTN|nr:hypothetical protein [Streptomyces coryli]NGN62421.1 hypothetical protein [Streptomyces coryli]